MKDDHFDDVIKNRLNDHESSVPINMWERISGKEKERRRIFMPRLYWLLLILLLLGGTGILLVANNPKLRLVARANRNSNQTKNKQQDFVKTKAAENNSSKKQNSGQLHKANSKGFFDTTAVVITNSNHAQNHNAVLQTKQTFSKPHASNTNAYSDVAHHASKRKKAVPFKTNSPARVASSDSLQDVITAEKTVTITPTVHLDSTDKKTKTAVEETAIRLAAPPQLTAGLQWQGPVASGAHYFSGANATQHYAIVLPGAWISFSSDRNRFAVEVQPWAAAPLPSKPFSTVQTRLDATTTRTTTQTLYKISGLTTALESQYNIHQKWWLGGSLQGSFWKKGIVATRNRDEKQDAPNHTIITEATTIKALAFKDPVLANFSTFQLFLNADLLYQTKNWQAGLRTGATFVQFAQRNGPAHQFQALFFMRRNMFQKSMH